jgi:hypothetical protein
MWHMNPKDMERMRKEMQRVRPALEELRRMRPFFEELMKNRPSPQEFAAIREHARWATEAARTIDPATIRALRDASSSAAVIDNARLLRGRLGPDGLAAAGFLVDRQVARRLRTPSREEGGQREERAREISPEKLRKAEELAASPEVRKLLESVDPDKLLEEAEGFLKQEGPPEIAAEEDGEVELYGISVEPSNTLLLAVILYVALQGALVSAPELAAAIRQALDDLADLLAVMVAVREFGVAGSPADKVEHEDDESALRAPRLEASNAAAVRLIDELMAEDPSYDEETWPQIEAALDRDRPSSRKLFAG